MKVKTSVYQWKLEGIWQITDDPIIWQLDKLRTRELKWYTKKHSEWQVLLPTFPSAFTYITLFCSSTFLVQMIGSLGNGGDSKIISGTKENGPLLLSPGRIPRKSCNWTPYLCSKQRIPRIPVLLRDLTDRGSSGWGKAQACFPGVREAL